MTAAISPRPGRNEACHCGSGRKYKHCCLAKDDAAAVAARASASAAEAEAGRPADEATAASVPARKAQTHQPWKTKTSRGFIPRTRTPRKVGGA
jgi:hypothetical protein